MKFDFCGQYKLDDAVLDYGWIKGNEQIVYIKAGLGGDFRGYDNKYVKIAQRLNDKYGCSVVSVSNPNVKSHTFVHDKKVIEDFILAGDYNSPKLYFFGHSNGGVKGLELASSGIIFKRMILVNMPLMINFHKTIKMINSIPNTEVLTVYGEKDPSFAYLPFLHEKGANLMVSSVPNADHNFKGMMDEFISLCDQLMK